MAGLTDLSLDILLLIVPHLTAKDFLSFCSTSKAFREIRLEPSFWRNTALSTFRVRNRPAAQNDGSHWYNLYKRMLTSTRVYGWGQNTYGCLGSEAQDPDVDEPPESPNGSANTIQDERPTPMVPPPRFRAHMPRGGRIRRSPHFNTSSISWPQEAKGARELGVIADLQCGGWSTSILNDQGVIYTTGTINGETIMAGRSTTFVPLKIPDFGLEERNEQKQKARWVNDSRNPRSTISKFSSGRSHILGLADDGSVWCWFDMSKPATAIHFNLAGGSHGEHSKWGKPTEVVAGWGNSSAYLTGVGILIWSEIRNELHRAPDIAVHEVNAELSVPRSGYRRPRGNARNVDEASRIEGEEVGEVVSYIVLQTFVVFVTDIRKVFAAPFQGVDANDFSHGSVELKELQAASESDPTPAVTDVQGSHQSFAVLKNNGEVLIANEEYLWACIQQNEQPNMLDSLPLPTRIPALQNEGVVQMAFGDYHFHALHKNGEITSYGYEPQDCGCLGLEDATAVWNSLRGRYIDLRAQHTMDVQLSPHAYLTGRRVCFQKEKQRYIVHLKANENMDSDRSGGPTGELSPELIARHLERKGEIGTQVEHLLRGWDKQSSLSSENTDGLGSHFALSVAAAGWHSGALVLVNNDLEKAVAESCLLPEEAAQANVERDGGIEHYMNTTTDIARYTIEPSTGRRYVWSVDRFPHLRLCPEQQQELAKKSNKEMEMSDRQHHSSGPFRYVGPNSGEKLWGVKDWAYREQGALEGSIEGE